MKQLSMVPLMVLVAIFGSFKSVGEKQPVGMKDFPSSNPFLTESSLPYQAPPFDKIKDSDFKPALEEGMKEQYAEIHKIADDPAAPTFDNTFVAMEKSGQLLTRVKNVFDVLTGANTNPQLQKVQEEVAPKLAANQDAIY